LLAHAASVTRVDVGQGRPPAFGALLALLHARGLLTSSPAQAPDERLDGAGIASGAFVRQLSLMVTLACNYACRNCFVYSEPSNVVPPAHTLMPWAVAENALEQFVALRERATARAETVVRIFGGEPFMNWSVIERIVGWLRVRSNPGRIYVTTNGSLLTDSRAEFLGTNGVTVFVSLNGIRAINDRVRIDHEGRSTFDRSVRGLIAELAQAQRTHVSVTLADDDSIDALPGLIELIDRLRPESTRPVVLYLSLMKGLVSETRFRASERTLADRIAELWLLALTRNIYLGGRLFHAFRNVFASAEAFDRWCERGTGFVVYPSGEIRPCSGTAIVLGHLRDLPRALASEEFSAVSRRIGGQIPGCHGCAVEGPCGGSCACSSRAGVREYRPGINCEFERAMFESAVKAFLTASSKGPGIDAALVGPAP